MRDRCIILIDGSNFYFKLRDLGFRNLLSFDFGGFTDLLHGCDEVIDKSVYHVGRIQTDGTAKTQRLFDSQRKLLAYLLKNNVEYKLGYLMKIHNTYHEKGVDVQIAVDILVAAYEKKCGRIYLISSDTDLIPAIQKAQERGVIVCYVGFSHKVSKALKRVCSETRILQKHMLHRLIKA